MAPVAPLAIAFAKHLGSLYLPSTSEGSAATTEHGQGATSGHDFPSLATNKADGEPETDEAIVPREIKDKFRKLLVAYFEALGKREQKLHLVRRDLSSDSPGHQTKQGGVEQELQKQDKRNHEAYIRSGEVFEDREKNYEKAVKAWERGWASVTQ